MRQNTLHMKLKVFYFMACGVNTSMHSIGWKSSQQLKTTTGLIKISIKFHRLARPNHVWYMLSNTENQIKWVSHEFCIENWFESWCDINIHCQSIASYVVQFVKIVRTLPKMACIQIILTYTDLLCYRTNILILPHSFSNFFFIWRISSHF